MNQQGTRRDITAIATLPNLYRSEFAKFCEAAHGFTAYPWQLRLAEHVFERGLWPTRLSFPCGAGRCVLMDIAIFHLALEANAAQRRAPLRIVHVLDRWTAQNSFFDHASHLAARLRAAMNSTDPQHILIRVALRLAFLSGTDQPFTVCALMGGAPREGDWTPSASQPSLLCSLVDTIGSRLLTRGYGVSATMKSVHAGLLGADCLWMLDDVRSEALRDTLRAVELFRRSPWTSTVTAPWSVLDVAVTRCQDPSAFGLSDEDSETPELARRLQSPKPTRLKLGNARSTDLLAHAKELIEYAWACSGIQDGTNGRTVAIVVNTIGLARSCANAMQSKIDHCSDARMLLLIGRSRLSECERYRQSALRRLIKGDANASSTLFVIATQCIEAGTDIDIDVLITQIASLDALQQRFSRLNRRGRSISTQSTILACRDEVKTLVGDTIYGEASRNTWNWLRERAKCEKAAFTGQPADDSRNDQGSLNFGTRAIEQALLSDSVAELLRPSAHAPILMPAYLDLLSQTSPIPATDPDVDLFLHGRADAGDVMILWRSDVELDTDDTLQRSCALLHVLPPRPEECIAIPVTAARAWLRGEPDQPVSDVQGVVSRPNLPRTPVARPTGRPALKWAGYRDRCTGRIYAHSLRSGDLIVVPSIYGGADESGWQASVDLVDPVPAVSAESVSRAIRLHPALLFRLLAQRGFRTAERVVDEIWRSLWNAYIKTTDRSDGAEVARQFVQISQLPEQWLMRLRRIARSKHASVIAPRYEAEAYEQGFVLTDHDPRSTQNPKPTVRMLPSTSEQLEPEFVVPPITLEEYAHRLQLSTAAIANGIFYGSLASDIVLAARLSIEGWRDPRYQAYLRGGDRLLSDLALTPMATPTVRFDSGESQDARERIELPSPWSPNVESLRLAASDARLHEAHDSLLVLWLIATMNGSGRPFLTHIDPLYIGPWCPHVRLLDQDWPEIFHTLQRRYGWWGLAHREAIFRLSVHRAWGLEHPRVRRGSAQVL